MKYVFVVDSFWGEDDEDVIFIIGLFLFWLVIRSFKVKYGEFDKF